MNKMNVLGLITASFLALNGCDSGNGNSKKASGIAEMDTVKTTTQIPFTDGVTDSNKGLKRGKVQVKGTIIGNSGKMYLYETEGKTNIKIDSVSIVGGAFDFGTDEYEAGMYMLGLSDQNMVAVILNPAEPTVEVGFRNMKLDGSLYAINSKENEGWVKYYPQEVALLKAVKDNMVAQAKSSIKEKFDDVIFQKQLELANLQGQLIKEYPGTFLAKLLTWKQEPYKTDKARYWNNVDFTDESLVHTLVMPDRIQNYMRAHSGGSESGFLNCVDLVVEKSKVNERVLEFNLYNMLGGFYESNMENISTYITDNYIFGEGCGDAEISNILKSKAEGIVNLRIGKVPPNMNMADLNGKNFDLRKTCAENKYTLIMFWSSWCEHCKGEAPEVSQYYNIWHPKGFEIVGVSVDTNVQLWKNAVQERGFTFPQVCGMKQWESKVAKDYKVTKTPTFFLLNSKGEIVLKPKGIREVNQWLSQNLK